jgi:prolyl-tRNA editing enzyme YbaK/EbsC (Cys-tRNA(Pro) deacylase)
MELGGVTALALPPDLRLWVDAAVMSRDRIILGGGSRSMKIHVAPDVFRSLPSVEVVEGLAS